MIVKLVLGGLLNFLAAAVPTTLAYLKFGADAKVDVHDPTQAFYLAGYMVVAFLLALLASLVGRKSQPSGIEEVASYLVKSFGRNEKQEGAR